MIMGEGIMKQKSGRTIGLYTKVSPEEAALIGRKMELLGIRNKRAYLRKMAVDGMIVNVDLACIRELVSLLRSTAASLNQIARRCNETRNLYREDVDDLRAAYAAIWEGVNGLLKKFEKL